MLGVHRPSKGFVQQIRRPTDVYCLCCMSTATAAASSSEVENICTAEGVFECGGLSTKKQKKCGVFHVTYSAWRGGKQSLVFQANSATFNSPNAAAVLGRDPDMLRNVLTTPLLSPQPKVREGTLGRRRAACVRKKNAEYTYTVESWCHSPR